LEGKLQREIKDILDELDIMINITKQQKDLIQRFCKHVENILDPDGRWCHGSEDQFLAQDDESEEEAVPTPERNDRSDEMQERKKDKDRVQREKLCDRKRRKKHLDWFRVQSQDLVSEVENRMDELEGLRESAKNTAQSVNDLQSMKQQQAQAWESVKLAEDAMRQNGPILVFTIITIVFVSH